MAAAIRRSVLTMVHAGKAAHVASALSIADIVAVLYSNVLQLDPKHPSSASRHRFILSKGHACAAVYAALAEIGVIEATLLHSYAQDDSPLMSHISHKVAGVEFSTGSLGHGLSFGAGKALAAKQLGFKYQTYVLMSDGEIAEGSNWEAMLFSAHHKLNNLTAIIDYNKLQSLDSVQNTLQIEPLTDKVRSFGWQTEIVDGHNHEQLFNALGKISEEAPRLIIANTVKGKGVSFMENKVEWHYRTPNPVELNFALSCIKE